MARRPGPENIATDLFGKAHQWPPIDDPDALQYSEIHEAKVAIDIVEQLDVAVQRAREIGLKIEDKLAKNFFPGARD